MPSRQLNASTALLISIGAQLRRWMAGHQVGEACSCVCGCVHAELLLHRELKAHESDCAADENQATFSGKRAEFEEWIFPFETNCGLPGWERFLDSAKASSEEMEMLILSDDAERVGRSLYHLLVSMTKGTAWSIVQLSER